MTTELEQFTQAVIAALYFTDTGEPERPSADAEIDEETRLDLEADCRSWWRRFGCYISQCPDKTPADAGHDFWLTRNGHGAGFWDGGWPEYYEKLFTDGAKGYGPFETYAGDDGKIYA